MTGQYIVQGIFALAGIISLLASLLNWNWFFTTRNAQTIVRNVGRNRARLFYGILGVRNGYLLLCRNTESYSNCRDFISKYLLITSIERFSGVVNKE